MAYFHQARDCLCFELGYSDHLLFQIVPGPPLLILQTLDIAQRIESGVWPSDQLVCSWDVEDEVEFDLVG